MTVDVFDTVLVRSVASPEAVPAMLGRLLEQDGTPGEAAAFAETRQRAADRAWRRCGGVDPPLAAIYTEVAAARRWTAERARAVLEREIDLEGRLLHPVPGMVERLARLRADGHRIAFLSDTSHASSTLRRWLDERGLLGADDRVYASCELGASKRRGDAFAAVVAVENRDGEVVRHLGNDAFADVRRAAEAGLAATHLPAANLTGDERRLVAGRDAHGLAQALAGAARLARLRTPAEGRQRAVRDVTADVAGPLLATFTRWSLERAVEREVRSVFFLAREGQVLHRLADHLRPADAAELSLRYLHVSRQSLNVAAMDGVSRAELSWVLTHVETNTVGTILRRLGLEPAAVAAPLRRLDLDAEALASVPDEDRREALLDDLVDGGLRPALDAAVAVRRARVRRHLEQQGVLPDGPVAFVDTTGTGSQQLALTRLCTAVGAPAPLHLLLYRRRLRPHPLLDALPVEAWLEDEVRQLGVGRPPGGSALIEVFCTADHGTVLDYRDEGEQVVPVLAEHDPTALERWGATTQRRTLDAFAQALEWPEGRAVASADDVREAVVDVARRFWERPTPGEADAWGRFPFEGASGADGAAGELASPYGWGEVVQAARAGGLPSRTWFGWRAGAEARTTPGLRRVLALLRLAKHRRDHLDRLHARTRRLRTRLARGSKASAQK
ncbi:hypothetical protein [Egicoccus halophilus]|uniref:hypothetical protein n=1 Tax=Egicoccus halophilus TaxID=1670830 RepID=UPI00103254C5|nr:hypothetical protein [Egicoccus halophilus]